MQIQKIICKIVGCLIFLSLLINYTSQVSAESCIYNSTITGNHIDIEMLSDLGNVWVLDIIQNNKTATYEQFYQPESVDWKTSWSTLTPDSYFALIGGSHGEEAYWGYNAINTPRQAIPDGIYGVDFSGSLTDYSIIRYAVDGNQFVYCGRNGDIGTSPPSPVNKVVFAPGFGGSWNTSSILTCQYDPNATWDLAPFAESVYNPLLTTLAPSDWSIIPFYYDWRQPVASNGNLLKQKIDSLNEKVNLVGHSMGGLVGRAYLENNGTDKVNSFLTAGSPHRGVAMAYPAWSGGEIWTDNFLAKIAATLYIKLCGQRGPLSNDRETIQNVLPSFRDLLPIDQYLTNTRNFSPPNIDDAEMDAKNLWMTGNTNWPILDIKLGSLSGTGFTTLQNIPVKEPSNRDISLGNWSDGKPAGKITTIEGDGTVLTSSSDINDTSVEFHPTIFQNHSGLVASNEGLNKIREFLGLPQLVSAASVFSEPNSSLILIGHPANFWVADQKGNVIKDKDGMIALMNPKSGNYKLNLSPKSDRTRFIVAQFLPNGDVKYKEYNFRGFANQLKNIKFNLNNPQEDILN